MVPNNKTWKEMYDKENYQYERSSALEDFWPSELRSIFVALSNEMNKKFGLNLTHPTYTKTTRWKFKFTKSGVPLVKNVIICDDCFYIDDIPVTSDSDMQKAVEYVDSLHNEDFVSAFNEKMVRRNKKQAERAARRIKREKDEKEWFESTIDPSKLNIFKWAPKVPRQYFIRLYKSDVRMIIDSELLDEVGLMLYVRCFQAKEECELSKAGKLKCHNCGVIITSPPNGLIVCNCGYSYIFREYMRSFNKNRMPYGAANPFFFKFIDDWPKKRTDAEKMALIDWVIHQCHLNMLSGVKRGFAGLNLIQGNLKQVTALINDLAYGDITVV